MFNKIIICILFLLISSTLEIQIKKLETYGSITVSEPTLIYMQLDGFKSGDTLYFEGSFSSVYKYKDVPLGFLEADLSNISDDDSNFVKVSSSSYSQMGSDQTYYFSYTLKGNYKYLFIITPKFQVTTNFKLEHTKGNNTIWIIIAIAAVIVIAIIIVVICRFRRGCC